MRTNDKPSLEEHPLAAPTSASETLGGRRRGSLWILWTVILLGTLGLGAGIDALWQADKGDSVPPEIAAQRQASFSGLTSIPVIAMGDQEERRILESMPLPAAEKQLLFDTLRHERGVWKTATQSADPEVEMLPSPNPQKTAAPAAAEKTPRPVTLAMITVWDTDAADGDVVRLVSVGYQVEVTLAKSPSIVAVPVPPHGVMNIVGVRDGGGGITAGVAVGGRPVELPVMSVGQTLGIPVVARP